MYLVLVQWNTDILVFGTGRVNFVYIQRVILQLYPVHVYTVIIEIVSFEDKTYIFW